MNVDELQKKALWVRGESLEMQARAGKGHLGGAFSVTDLLVGIYYSEIFRTSHKWWGKPARDRVFFSKGHAALALYPILADQGFFPKKELMKYGKNGTILGGHPDHFIPGVEVSTGSLGHGLGVAAGLALSAKLNKKDFLSIAILGDGECNEGSVWEAALFGRQQSLGNLNLNIFIRGESDEFIKHLLDTHSLSAADVIDLSRLALVNKEPISHNRIPNIHKSPDAVKITYP